MSEPLKLRAVDANDLAVIGACLQDALVPVQDMCFLADEHRFVMVANRFCWEKLKGPDGGAPGQRVPRPPAGQSAETYQRVHCGITFEHVTGVKTMGFAPAAGADQGRLLEVLTIIVEGDELEGNALTVVFSGHTAVRLEVEAIEAFIQDLGEPWPTMWRPHHPVEDEPDQEGGA